MWKVVGVIESRGGDIEIMPEWTIGKPNEFNSIADANAIRDAMQGQIEKERLARLAAAPGVGGAGPAIRYMVLPAIDEALIRQLHGGEPMPAPKPSGPVLSFNAPKPSV
jgi:hypothetical protein